MVLKGKRKKRIISEKSLDKKRILLYSIGKRTKRGG
jgi:hypothetical protein